MVVLAAHFARVPAVVPDKPKALGGDVLGDGSDEVAGSEDLEVAPDLRVHAGAVHDRPAGRVDLHLLDGQGVPDDVLGQALRVFAFVGSFGQSPSRLLPSRV